MGRFSLHIGNMTCDYDHDRWPIEVELKGFTKAYHLPKEKSVSS